MTNKEKILIVLREANKRMKTDPIMALDDLSFVFDDYLRRDKEAIGEILSELKADNLNKHIILSVLTLTLPLRKDPILSLLRKTFFNRAKRALIRRNEFIDGPSGTLDGLE